MKGHLYLWFAVLLLAKRRVAVGTVNSNIVLFPASASHCFSL